MKKLRLLITSKCPQNCKGCCNKDWELNKLPICYDYTGYDEILITGGEPMLYHKQIPNIIKEIRTVHQDVTPIYIYTADVTPKKIKYIFAVEENYRPSGLTVTLHSHADAARFYHLVASKTGAFLHDDVNEYGDLSLRLNIFKGINVKAVEEDFPRCFRDWKIKDNIKWIKNCPLPKDEVFMKYNW